MDLSKTFTKRRIREVLAQLHGAIEDWRGWFRRETINPLLYVQQVPSEERTNVYRKRDNQLILSMNYRGDIYPFHMGLWDSDEAIAIGEALVILGKGYKAFAERQAAPGYSAREEREREKEFPDQWTPTLHD